MARKKALVVDNDFFFVEFFSELLEKQNYEVYKAYDGKEGITILSEVVPDLLFVDFVMPKIDGKQLIGYARMKYPEAGFTIIGISGTIIEQLEELIDIGADFYIAKGPLDKMTLQFNEFLGNIENGPFFAEPGKNVLDPGMIFPRREAVDLIEAVNFQKAVFESIGIGILIIDKDTRVLNANSMALGILHKPVVEVINRKIFQLLSKRDAAKLAEVMKALVRSRSGTKNRHIIVNAGKRKAEVSVSLFSLKKQFIGWIVALWCKIDRPDEEIKDH